MEENSILIRYITIMAYKFQLSAKGSLLVRILMKCFGFLSGMFRSSCLYKTACKTGACLKAVLSGSAVANSFRAKEPAFDKWSGSFLFKAANNIVNFPVNVGNRLFAGFQHIVEDSAVIRVSKILLGRFEIIAALVIAAILLVPDHKWYNIYTLVIAVGLVMLFIYKTVIFRQDGFNTAYLDFVYVLYFASTVLATVTSVNMGLSVRFLLFHLTCFLFVLLVVSITKSEESLKAFLNVLTAGITLTAAYGLWQAATGAVPFDPALTDLDANQGMPGRIFSTMGNANNYAELLIMYLPFIIMLFFSTRRFYARLAYFVSGAVVLGALGFTGSRSSWGGFLLAVFIIVFFKKKSLIPIMLVLMLGAVPFLPDFIVKRFMTIFKASSDSSMETRVLIFDTVLPVIKDYWVTGTGLGTDVLGKLLERYRLRVTLNVPHTHILYTQILIETGIVGLLTFLASMVRIFRKSVANLYGSGDEFHKNILIAGVGSLAGILTVCFVEYVWYYPRIMLMFWISAAIVFSAIGNINRKQWKQV